MPAPRPDRGPFAWSSGPPAPSGAMRCAASSAGRRWSWRGSSSMTRTRSARTRASWSACPAPGVVCTGDAGPDHGHGRRLRAAHAAARLLLRLRPRRRPGDHLRPAGLGQERHHHHRLRLSQVLRPRRGRQHRGRLRPGRHHPARHRDQPRFHERLPAAGPHRPVRPGRPHLRTRVVRLPRAPLPPGRRGPDRVHPLGRGLRHHGPALPGVPAHALRRERAAGRRRAGRTAGRGGGDRRVRGRRPRVRDRRRAGPRRDGLRLPLGLLRAGARPALHDRRGASTRPTPPRPPAGRSPASRCTSRACRSCRCGWRTSATGSPPRRRTRSTPSPPSAPPRPASAPCLDLPLPTGRGRSAWPHRRTGASGAQGRCPRR